MVPIDLVADRTLVARPGCGRTEGSCVMTTGVVIALISIFLAGMLTGIVGLVTLASRREDRLPLSNRPQGFVAKGGRYVTGLKLNLPQDGGDDWHQTGYQTGFPGSPDAPTGRRPRPRRRTGVH